MVASTPQVREAWLVIGEVATRLSFTADASRSEGLWVGETAAPARSLGADRAAPSRKNGDAHTVRERLSSGDGRTPCRRGPKFQARERCFVVSMAASPHRLDGGGARQNVRVD